MHAHVSKCASLCLKYVSEYVPKKPSRITPGGLSFIPRSCVEKAYRGILIVIDVGPLMCGEGDITRPACRPPAETPPRAWGRPPVRRKLVSSFRNTPTCVGKAFDYEVNGETLQKHPHVRGEGPERLFTFFTESSKRYYGVIFFRHKLQP